VFFWLTIACFSVVSAAAAASPAAARSVIDSVVDALQNIQCPDFLSFLCDLVRFTVLGQLLRGR
jgi:hypothetical protein